MREPYVYLQKRVLAVQVAVLECREHVAGLNDVALY